MGGVENKLWITEQKSMQAFFKQNACRNVHENKYSNVETIMLPQSCKLVMDSEQLQCVWKQKLCKESISEKLLSKGFLQSQRFGQKYLQTTLKHT